MLMLALGVFTHSQTVSYYLLVNLHNLLKDLLSVSFNCWYFFFLPFFYLYLIFLLNSCKKFATFLFSHCINCKLFWFKVIAMRQYGDANKEQLTTLALSFSA